MQNVITPRTGRAQDTTIDGLLDRRVTLEQPAEGYRVAVDTVLLAAAVPAEEGQKALDLGCGVGGAMLSLACRVPGIAITGIEIQEDLAALGRSNLARNAFAAGLEIRSGDVTELPDDCVDCFDHVLMNPPYHDVARHDVSEHKQKQVANTEKNGDLKLWVASAAKALRPQGLFTIIHRADRVEEILRLLQGGFGTIEVMPLLPKAGGTPKRVLLRAEKSSGTGVRFCRNFVLHQADGKYTEEAEGVLRHMKELQFKPPK